MYNKQDEKRLLALQKVISYTNNNAVKYNTDARKFLEIELAYQIKNRQSN